MAPSPIRTSPVISRMVTSPACRSFTSSSAMAFSVQIFLLEAVECLGFALVNVEDSQELRNRQQVLKFLGEIEQLELASFFADSRITGNQFANAAGIDVTHTSKVQQNSLFTLFEQSPDRSATRDTAFTDSYLSAHVKNGDIS